MIEKESIYHHSLVNFSTSFEPVYPRFTLNEKKNQIFMPKVVGKDQMDTLISNNRVLSSRHLVNFLVRLPFCITFLPSHVSVVGRQSSQGGAHPINSKMIQAC
jgi:hypothetical protein